MNQTQPHGPYQPPEFRKPPSWANVMLVALVVFLTVYVLGSLYVYMVGH